MAPEVLDASELIFRNAEMQLKHNYIMYIEGIPSFMIKSTKKPAINFNVIKMDYMNVYRKVKGKGEWQDINITLYTPISPSGAQIVIDWIKLHHESISGIDGYSDMYKKDITLQMTGPTGDKIEEWVLKGAFIQSTDFGDVSWSDDSPVEIQMTLSYDYALLNY